MEKTLNEHLRFERLISEISARFVNISPDQVGLEIENGLKEILEFFQVDRCGLFRASRDTATWQVTHAASADDIPPIPLKTDLPVSLFPWTYKKIVEQHEVMSFTTLEELPAEASTDKQTFIAWGIKSTMDIPVITGDVDNYFIALNAVRSERAWPDEYIPRLRLLGGVFVNALSRAQMRVQLEERMALARFHAGISSRFVNVPPQQIDAEIDGSLQSIARYLDIERVIMSQLSDDESHMIVTHSWAAPGYKTRMGVIASAEMPWIFQKVMRGETVVCSCVEDLPAEAARDKKFLKEAGSQSNISIPLMSGGKVLGFVGLGSLSRQRNWPDKMVGDLRSVLQIFANALARKRADQALRESEVRLDLAASSAEVGLWILDFGTGHFWATDKARELFGYAKEEEINFETFLNRVHPDDREHVRRSVEQSIKAKENIKVEYRIVLTDESVRWIISRGRPYFSASGEPERVMGVSMDITERKQADGALQKAYHEIKQLKDQLEAENIYLRQEVSRESDFEHIIGTSGVLMKVLRQVEQVAATDSTVLLSGETGTGKELIAQAVHNLSPRHGRLMVKVNCATLPAALIESELFGRERGAYTGALARQIGRFELADRSTLFLDEITELPLDLQAKLLRVLENGEFERLGSPKTIRVDVRLIAATNRDMAQEVRKGAFRADLYYRLNVFPIEVPPLRERPDDIPLLVEAFVHEFAVKMGKKFQAVPQKTMQALQRYHWPGNIRELRNVLEQAIIISSGSNLQVNLPQAPAGASFKNQTMEETEYQHIMDVLSKTGWRIKGSNGAATLLGLKPSTLYSRMNKLGIPNRREKDGISP